MRLPLLGLGVPVHSPSFLHVTERLSHVADFFEIVPETTWQLSPDGTSEFNLYADMIDDLLKRTGKPAYAHGLGLSCGTVCKTPNDDDVDMLARSQKRFGYACFLEHMGFARHGKMFSGLPLPVSFNGATSRAVADSMQKLATMHPFVGFENLAFPFVVDNPANEPDFYARVLRESSAWLLLDVHNVHVNCTNSGLDWRGYLDALPLDRVLMLHASGGSPSDPEWLASGRTLLMDSHDTRIPETVWDMLAYVLPRCPNVRGIVLERAESSIGDDDLTDEYARARALWDDARTALNPEVAPRGPLHAGTPPDGQSEEALQAAVMAAMFDPDPWERFRSSAAAADAQKWADADGVRIASLMVGKLRFERLLRGDPSVNDLLEADPAGFVELFDAYQAAVPPHFFHPAQEAAAFAGFTLSKHF